MGKKRPRKGEGGEGRRKVAKKKKREHTGSKPVNFHPFKTNHLPVKIAFSVIPAEFHGSEFISKIRRKLQIFRTASEKPGKI